VRSALKNANDTTADLLDPVSASRQQHGVNSRRFKAFR